MRALSGESLEDVEIFVRNPTVPDGLVVNMSARPISRNGGGFKGGVLTCRDITRDKEAEARLEQAVSELRHQNQLLETVMDNIDDGIILSDATDRILFVNAVASWVLGKSKDGSTLDIPLGERSKALGIFHFIDQEAHVPPEQLPLVRAVRGEDTDEMDLFIRNSSHPEGIHVGIRGRTLRDDVTNRVQAGMAIMRDLSGNQEKSGPEPTAGEQPGRTRLDVPLANYEEMEIRLEKTVDELRHQAQLLEAICDNIDDGIIVADTQGRILFANATVERIFGEWIIDPEVDAWSKTFGIFYPDVKTPVPVDQLPLTRAIQGETTDAMEFFIRNQKNTVGTYVSVVGRPILSPDKSRVVAGLAVLRDLTQEKESAAKLQESMDRLSSQAQLMETILENMSDGMLAADAQGNLILSNPRMEEMVGMGLSDSGPDQWSETYGIYELDQKTLIPTDQLPLSRALRGEKSDGVEMFVRNARSPNGVYLSVSGRPLWRDGSKSEGPAGVVFFHDITRHKVEEAQMGQTIAELQDQARFLETVLEAVSDGLFVADRRGRLLFNNSSAEQIFGKGGHGH